MNSTSTSREVAEQNWEWAWSPDETKPEVSRDVWVQTLLESWTRPELRGLKIGAENLLLVSEGQHFLLDLMQAHRAPVTSLTYKLFGQLLLPRELYESSTDWSDLAAEKELDEVIAALFERNAGEAFEDGMESNFSRDLTAYILNYGNSAVEVILYLITYEKVNSETAAEALRWIALVEHQDSYNYRMWLLQASLSCSSARVRDAAALGLSVLKDRKAIDSLRKAIEKEKIEELKHDMLQVLQQLETV